MPESSACRITIFIQIRRLTAKNTFYITQIQCRANIKPNWRAIGQYRQPVITYFHSREKHNSANHQSNFGCQKQNLLLGCLSPIIEASSTIKLHSPAGYVPKKIALLLPLLLPVINVPMNSKKPESWCKLIKLLPRGLWSQ